METTVQFPDRPSIRVMVIGCVAALLLLVYSLAYSQQYQAQAPTAANQEEAPIPAEQLDSLVAPIALYPDPLLAQTLAASTYPLEVIQLQQWMVNNRYLKDQALADAVEMQRWDPSVQAMVAFPDVVKLLSDNIAWMTDLGNAFLAQQADVMDAVQRMRATAQRNGNLNTTPEQTVQIQTVEGGEQAFVIEPADPEMVYVPSYDPTVVYGNSAYAYPTLYYASPAYYRAGGALAFGAGVALGAAWANNWGNCDWKHGDVNINNNNSFNRNVNRNVNRGSVTGQGNTWQHNPQHRGNAPYGNRQTANRYGGTARGEPGTLGAGARGGGAAGSLTGGGIGAGNINAGNRPGGGAGLNRGGGANGVGNRAVSSGPGFGSNNNAFGGGGFNGGAARSAGNRGGASMGSGGYSHGGGGGGRAAGGSRGGGGGRRR